MKKILSMWPFAVSGTLVGLYLFLDAHDEWLISKIVLGTVAVVLAGYVVYLFGDLIRHMVTKHGDNDVEDPRG